MSSHGPWTRLGADRFAFEQTVLFYSVARSACINSLPEWTLGSSCEGRLDAWGPHDYTFSAKGRGKGQGAAEQQQDASQTQQWQETSVWGQ